jgi:hypothetical protein
MLAMAFPATQLRIFGQASVHCNAGQPRDPLTQITIPSSPD